MKKIISIALILCMVLCFAACGETEDTAVAYPEENITVIVPWAAGGATDLLARLIADKMTEALDVSVVVENKEGGSGAIGHNAGSSAEGDGYTVTMFTTEASTAHLAGIADYSYEDFTPVSLVAVGPCALSVPANSEFETLDDVIAFAKANPGKLSIASNSPGGIWNICAEQFIGAAQIDANLVPFDGGGPAITAALGNQVDVVVSGFSEALPYAVNGDLKVLAVGAETAPDSLPDAPVFADYGMDVTACAYWAFGVPTSTPDDVVASLEGILNTAINSDDVQAFLLERGFQAKYMATTDFAAWLAESDEAFKAILQ